MSAYTNNANEQDLMDGLYMVETEDRLEMVQLTQVSDVSCCGDSGSGSDLTLDPITGLPVIY